MAGGSYDWDHILLDFCGKRYEAEEGTEVYLDGDCQYGHESAHERVVRLTVTRRTKAVIVCCARVMMGDFLLYV